MVFDRTQRKTYHMVFQVPRHRLIQCLSDGLKESQSEPGWCICPNPRLVVHCVRRVHDWLAMHETQSHLTGDLVRHVSAFQKGGRHSYSGSAARQQGTSLLDCVGTMADLIVVELVRCPVEAEDQRSMGFRYRYLFVFRHWGSELLAVV